ncbi:trypsin-like serine peptidase [Fodinicola feengrottensis]
MTRIRLALVAVTAAALVGAALVGVAAPAASAPQSVPSAHDFGGWPTVGALLTTNGTDHSPQTHNCTASVVNSPHHNLIMTAAHCVYDSGSGWRKYLAFFPGYNGGPSSTYGSWYAYGRGVKMLVNQGWITNRDPAYDYAFIVLTPSGGKSVQDRTGALNLSFDTGLPKKIDLVGYPANGAKPRICSGSTTGGKVQQWFVQFDCTNLPGGTSGSPWTVQGSKNVIGLTGGYEEGGGAVHNYSVYFDHETRDLYQRAEAL